MPEEDFHLSNQVHFQAHQGTTLVGPHKATAMRALAPEALFSCRVQSFLKATAIRPYVNALR
jgi:hypothetical protein